jgi:Domain of unknown function (DUF4123)
MVVAPFPYLENSTMPTPIDFTLSLINEHQYALVDQVLFPDLPEAWGLIPLVPHGLEAEAQAKLLPALLPLFQLSPEVKAECFSAIQTAYDEGQALPIQTLLQSEADLPAMQHHWAKSLVMQSSSGKRALLRSYDPRVWIHLQWILTPEQLHTLYGPATTWTIFLPFENREWISYSAPNEAPQASASFGGTPLAYDDTTYSNIFDIQIINQVLQEQSKQTLEALSSTSHHIHDLIQQAKLYGLQRQDEQQCFVEHALAYGANFHLHPIIQTLLQTVDREEQTYLDATALLGPAQWASIQIATP